MDEIQRHHHGLDARSISLPDRNSGTINRGDISCAIRSISVPTHPPVAQAVMPISIFWTGEKLPGDQQILAQAPLSRIPLYVRAGAILPLGPAREFAAEDPDAPVELRVYPGADGSFDLYSDQGDGYGYEKGERAVIPVAWSDASQTLRFRALQGSYPGITRDRIFQVVVVGPGNGVGPEATVNYKEVHYTGDAMTVRLR